MIQIYKAVNHFQNLSSAHTGMRCYLMPGASTPVKYQPLAVCVFVCIYILPVTHAKHSEKKPQQHTELQVQCVNRMLTNVIEGSQRRSRTFLACLLIYWSFRTTEIHVKLNESYQLHVNTQID